ncbi:hypothetical protein CRENBAI_017744 [Crenichthys baileyi]|uniref:Plakophilin 2 n=1 Tax=Crenichthys baileyi TaxID=28760 RepID=A0AAV9SRA1_9TELE
MSFLQWTLSTKDSLHHEDTSLALPTQTTAKTSTRTESDQNLLRVQRQVQLTLRRKKSISNRGVDLQRNTSRSLDDTDGLFTNTKVNRSDINRLSLKGIHAQRLSRGVGASHPHNTKLSHCHSPLTLRALIDWPVGSNSAQQYAFSEKSRDRATCAPIPPPGMYRSNLLRHSGSAKYPSASIAFQQSSRDAWSPRQSVVKHDQHTAQQSMHRMSGPTQQDRGFAWQANLSQRQKSNLPFLHSMEVDMRWQEETPPSQKSVKKPVEMTLPRALGHLNDIDEERLISAAKYIQTQCFQEDEPRNTVFIFNGVAKLLPLLENDSEEMQCAAAGALRNAVYMNDDNKEQVKETKGLPVILKALANTRNKETIAQLAALLWNLSSDYTIKELFNTEFLHIITKSAVVPGSGMSVAENPKDEMIADPKAFYFATACLRNLSSASANIRKCMRECENLIDSLVYYIQSAVDSRKPDDESTEHCACILQNLTYEAEFDLTSQTTKHQKEFEQDTAPKKTVGCFPHRRSMPTEDVKDTNDAENMRLLPEDKDPHGAEWLWSKTLVRLYLSLVACSKRSLTQQAALGALQNLTARKGPISEYVAYAIEKEKGMWRIKNVLEGQDSQLKNPAMFLTSHLSRYPELCPSIFNELLPGVVRMVHSLDTKTSVSDEVTMHLCQILTNLSKCDVDYATVIIDLKAMQQMLSIKHKGKAKQAADILLYTMWMHKDLHNSLDELGLFKNNRIVQKNVKRSWQGELHCGKAEMGEESGETFGTLLQWMAS